MAGDNGVKELNQKHWKIIVDEKTGKEWSKFSETKIWMVEPTCQWLNEMKTRGIPIKAV